MRRYLFAFFICISLPLPASAGERVITVAIDAEYAPYEYQSPSGNIEGFTPSLLREIGSSLSISFKFKPMSWPDAVRQLESGEVDIINMIHTTDRSHNYEFSLPHSGIEQAIFRNSNFDHIDGIESLSGSVVAIQKNDIAAEKLSKNDSFSVLLVANKQQGFLAVESGKASAFITAEQPGMSFLRKHPMEGVEIAKLGLWPQQFCFAAKKGNISLIKKLNEGLAELKRTGKYEEIYNHWMVKPDQWVVEYKQHILTSIALLLLAICGVAFLNHRKNLRNKKLESLLSKLDESQEKYRSTVDSISDGLITMEGELLVVTHFNAAAEEILGQKAESVLGKPIFDTFVEAKGSIFETQYRQVFKNRITTSFETYFGTPPYENWYEVRVYPSSNGISAFFTVITDRKKAEKELSDLNQQLESFSYKDGLTSIGNRRSFDQALEREWAHAQRNQEYISLILIDIDFFKGYNDHYGHLAGDECLKLIAKELESVSMRSTDLVARYGGEEFAIILPQTGPKEAAALARRCLSKVENRQIPYEYSPVKHVVTISAGVSSIKPSAAIQQEQLIEIADKQLYLAKEQGRGQFKAAEHNVLALEPNLRSTKAPKS